LYFFNDDGDNNGNGGFDVFVKRDYGAETQSSFTIFMRMERLYESF
jgi:hypothetical protein